MFRDKLAVQSKVSEVELSRISPCSLLDHAISFHETNGDKYHEVMTVAACRIKRK